MVVKVLTLLSSKNVLVNNSQSDIKKEAQMSLFFFATNKKEALRASFGYQN